MGTRRSGQHGRTGDKKRIIIVGSKRKKGSGEHGLNERIIRLLDIIARIRGGVDVSPKTLADEYGVTKTTIHNDINLLKNSGFDIAFDAHRGAHGSYYFSSKPFLPAMDLSGDDVLPFVLFQAMLGEGSGRTLGKIKSALSDADTKKFDILNEKIAHVDMTDRERQYLPELAKAVAEKKALAVKYFIHGQNKDGLFTVSPYLLTFRNVNWYLVGYCHEKNDITILKLERIRGISHPLLANRGPQFIEKPFNAKEYFKNSLHIYRGKEMTVKLWLHRDVVRFFEETPYLKRGKIEKMPKGNAYFTITVSGSTEIKRIIGKYLEKVRVLEPRSLVEEIKSSAEEMHRYYRTV